LKNVSLISFGLPRHEPSFQELVRQIRDQKAEQIKLREEMKKAQEQQEVDEKKAKRKLARMGVKNLTNNNENHLPLTPLALQLINEESHKHRKYEKLIKVKGK